MSCPPFPFLFLIFRPTSVQLGLLKSRYFRQQNALGRDDYPFANEIPIFKAFGTHETTMLTCYFGQQKESVRRQTRNLVLKKCKIAENDNKFKG